MKILTRGDNWFRVFGKGLYWKNLDKESMSFSERNKHTKYIIRFGYLIGILK